MEEIDLQTLAITENDTFTFENDDDEFPPKPSEIATNLMCSIEIKNLHTKYNTNENQDPITYFKELKKRIKNYKKEVFDSLTTENKAFIYLLNKHTKLCIKKTLQSRIERIESKLQKRQPYNLKNEMCVLYIYGRNRFRNISNYGKL